METQFPFSSGATHGELARSLGIPKGTASKLLSRLGELGYVGVSEGGQYRIGPTLMALSHEVRQHSPVYTSVRPVLERIATETGETVTLSIEVDGSFDTAGSMVVIDHVASVHPIRYVVPLGLPMASHITATGRVLLAFSDRSAKSVPQSVELNREQFDADLKSARANGYFTMTVEELTTIAVPVLDQAGIAVAAIAVTGVTHRLSDPEHRVWPVLQAALADFRLG